MARSDLCPVCGNEAGKHVHYGGKACVSCRAFFRRSVQNESYKRFACHSHGGCKIDSKSWKSCRWCRFQKCLASGMNPGFVLNESERQVRHEKRTFGVQKKLNQRLNSAISHCTVLINPSLLVDFTKSESSNKIRSVYMPITNESEKLLWTFTQDEHHELQSMMMSFRRNITKTALKFYSKNQQLFKEFIEALYLRTKIRYESYRKMEGCWNSWLADLCVKHTALGTLQHQDYSLLLKYNLPVHQVVIQSIMFGNSFEFRDSSMAEVLMRLITLQSVEYGDIEFENEMIELNGIMSDLNVGKNLPERPITYDQIFHSPWAASADIEDRHHELTFQMSPWPTDNSLQQPIVDKLQVFLLLNVIMLSTDHVQVKDNLKVTKLQDYYLSMLHRYLKFKYNKDANVKLAEGMMMSSLAREAHEIRLLRLPV